MEFSSFKCTHCSKEFGSYNGLAKHATRTHKVTPADLQVEVYHNNIWPACACGCGEKLNFGTSVPGKFATYKKGHHKIKGGFWTKEGLEKSAQTRREKFASGELVSYNKGKKESELYSPEVVAKRQAANKSETRRQKISKALKGKEKSVEEKMRLAKMSRDYWSNPNHTKRSKVEFEFEAILKLLNIDHQTQHPVLTYKYDFLVGDKLLVEIDGDYWHCNESLGYFPVGKGQQRTKKYDKIKNKVAADNGFTLLRFWENDIKNNKKDVIAKLLTYL